MKDYTDITVLLDRSGSMGTIKDDVIGGFNDFVKGQKKAGDNASLTLIQFDTEGIDSVHTATPIKDVPAMTTETYQPRAGTPLLDALGSTIHKTGERLAAIEEDQRPDKVVFVTITDGYENASEEYSKAAVKSLITQQSEAYKWQFIYLGANQDAFAEAGSVGMAAAMAANYTPKNVGVAMRVASVNVMNYRGTSDPDDLAYTDAQRKEMEDDEDSKQSDPK